MQRPRDGNGPGVTRWCQEQGASLVAQLAKNLLVMQETPVQFLGQEVPLEEGKATHSSILGLPGWPAGKESAGNAGDLGSIPGLGRSSGEGKGYALQYPGLESSMDCIVQGVAKSSTRLGDLHFHFSLEEQERGKCLKVSTGRGGQEVRDRGAPTGALRGLREPHPESGGSGSVSGCCEECALVALLGRGGRLGGQRGESRGWGEWSPGGLDVGDGTRGVLLYLKGQLMGSADGLDAECEREKTNKTFRLWPQRLGPPKGRL